LRFEGLSGLPPGPDADLDGLSDSLENYLGTDRNQTDTDGDGMTDGYEILVGESDATSPDSDGDGIPDGEDPDSSPAKSPDLDADGDGVSNGEDADPLDAVIDWRRGAEPNFVVVPLDITNPEDVSLADFIPLPSALFSRNVNGTSDSMLLVDRKLDVHTFEHGMITLGDEGTDNPADTFHSDARIPFVRDSVLGVWLTNTSQGQVEGLWNLEAPEGQQYTRYDIHSEYPGISHPDDILDTRFGGPTGSEYFAVYSKGGSGFEGSLFTAHNEIHLRDTSHQSTACRIEENGNIVSENSYWRFDWQTKQYGTAFATGSGAGEARSATFKQEIGGVESVWNLASGESGLMVAKNGGNFLASRTQAAGRVTGVSKQGWLAAEDKIWANGKWQNVVDFLPPGRLSAEVLDMLDSGLAVARLDGGTADEELAFLLPVDLKVDTDRSGEADAADEAGEDEWTNERGAIYQVNFDRDGNNTHDGKPAPDGALWWRNQTQPDYENWKIENEDDAKDLAPLLIAPVDGLGEDGKVFLKVAESEDYKAIHLFPKRKAGTDAIWGGILSDGRPWTDDDSNELDIEITKWVNKDATNFEETRENSEGDFEFGIEGVLLRGMHVVGGTLPYATNKFSGEIEFTIEYEINGQRSEGDTVKLKVAPWLMVDRSSQAKTTFVSQVDQNPVLQNLPKANVISNAPSQFTQDHAEIGYTQYPGGAAHGLTFILPYGSDKLPNWVLTEFLGPEKGVFGIGDSFGNGSADFGGNLELCPPHTGFPLGRIVYGSNMGINLRKFLVAQEHQLPLGASADGANPGGIDVSYLSVAHVDEIIAFREDGTALVADPKAGADLLNGFSTVDEKLRGVLFSAGSSRPVTAQIAQDAGSFSNLTVVTTASHATNGAAWEKYEGGYIRIATGGGKGQMARIKTVGEQEDGTYQGKITLTIDLCYRTGSTSLGGSARFRDPRQNTRSGNEGWFSAPKKDDYFVIMESDEVLWWPDELALDLGISQKGLPAPITVGEVLSDSSFLDYNRDLKTKIDAALNVIPQEVAKKPVPVLFHARSANSGKSFVPNAVNSQQIDGTTFYPEQFGPRDGQSKDVFKEAVEPVLGNASAKDVWYFFHTFQGEVHCGTNIGREPEADWWSKLKN
ncbi:hypothetical protein JIN78_02955, partial [Roseibacillus ishigakijimensis]